MACVCAGCCTSTVCTGTYRDLYRWKPLPVDSTCSIRIGATLAIIERYSLDYGRLSSAPRLYSNRTRLYTWHS